MNSALFTLSGKRVFVAGGTRGIGRAISSHFARSGAHVIASYVRDDDAAGSLVKELSG
jgi:NAD(P)-dependent dehydrogenase (short-subunit alcohol dehydrogenase family)